MGIWETFREFDTLHNRLIAGLMFLNVCRKAVSSKILLCIPVMLVF